LRNKARTLLLGGGTVIAKTALILGLLVLASSAGMMAHSSSRGQEEVKKKDFNGDGFVDTLTCLSEGGSGFGGDFVTLKDGKTGEEYAYNNWGSYGQFLRLIPFDDRLASHENRGFREALEQALFKDIQLGPLENSLAWLVDAYSKSVTDPDASLFSQKIHFQLRWTEGEVLPPASYYLVTSDETLFRSCPIYQEDNSVYDAAHRQGWLVYYADSHQDLELAFASGDVRVFKSAHGVVVSEGGRSSWVFVNDEVLADGPPKLRWPSISKVVLSEGLIFIHHAGGIEHLYVVDYHRGVVGRLREDIFPGSGGDFDVRDGHMIVRKGTAEKTIDLAALKESLK
jgi:hypothetical protein